MAKLILGPLLRRVTKDRAAIWVQTDAPATVTVTAGDAVTTASTFTAEGVHLALPLLSGLPAGRHLYSVDIDGVRAWPLEGNPPSVITIRDEAHGDATIVFGSCRQMKPQPGPDALEAYAMRAMQTGTLPDLLALIGDQIYADHAWAFGEYVQLYFDAWSVPAVRWLLSTVSIVMIFDDHEIHDDWNSSASWLAEMQARPGWDEHLRAGLHSYWLFQHMGNVDTRQMPSDWSFTVAIGRTRLIMLDCRGSRVLHGPVRRMFPQSQWDNLAKATRADCDHLVLAASLPWLLAPAIHHAEAIMEVLSRYRVMELLRRKYDLEHWAAVGHSFDELTALILGITGPATVSVLGGDVHHSYIARVSGRSNVHQITCSPLHNRAGLDTRLLLRLGWWPALSGPAALIARLAGVPRPAIDWKPLTRPYFGNAIATLTHRGRSASVLIEGTRPDGSLFPVAGQVLHEGR